MSGLLFECLGWCCLVNPITHRPTSQVVSLHGMNAGVRHTVMCSYGERLLLFSTKDSTKVSMYMLSTRLNTVLRVCGGLPVFRIHASSRFLQCLSLIWHQ